MASDFKRIGFKSILEELANADNRVDGDYIDEQGFLCCGVCHQRKQYETDLFGDGKRKVPIACKCDDERLQKAIDDIKRDELRKAMTSNGKYDKMTFANDDGSNEQVTKICKEYISDWERMYQNNIGVMFYGSVGTGKTHMACSLANALIDNLASVEIISLSSFLNQSAKFGELDEKIARLMKFKYLMIDDFGAERTTEYANEQVFNLINARYLSEKPVIITTNLSLEQMENEGNIDKHRIYERVLEMCPMRIKMVGKSKRTVIADEKRKLAAEILKRGVSK